MRSFIYSVVELLADHPEKCKIKCFENKKKILIEVFVHPGDVGVLLGKGGIIAKSIRNIGIAIGARHRKLFRVIVLGTEDSEDDKNLEKRRRKIVDIRSNIGDE